MELYKTVNEVYDIYENEENSICTYHIFLKGSDVFWESPFSTPEEILLVINILTDNINRINANIETIILNAEPPQPKKKTFGGKLTSEY